MLGTMNRKGFASVFILAVFVIALAVVGAIWYYKAHSPQISATVPTEPTAEVASSSTPSSSAPFITPNVVSAGGMVVLHGTFSVCGSDTPQGGCTEDRFNEPVLLQGGDVISSNLSGALSSGNDIAYQVPVSLAPGEYEFAIQNCLGKGCSDHPLGSFTVSAPGLFTTPTINSISPTSTTDLTSVITIYGSGFTPSDNYIGVTAIDGNGDSMLYYIDDASSADGKTITFQFPACYATAPPCGSFAYGTNHFAISNTNGTSNLIPFGLLVQPYFFQK